MIKAELKGKTKLDSIVEAIEAKYIKAQTDSVASATLILHERTVKLIRDKSPGTSQIRYGAKGKKGKGKKRTVTVSNPGEAPNTDTGRLIKSIKFDFKKKGLQGRVGSNLKYARSLEFGTKKMEPRPFLSTAILEEFDNMKKIFMDNMKKAVKE